MVWRRRAEAERRRIRRPAALDWARAEAPPEVILFEIVSVCSGNICRSPMVEQWLRARLSDLVESGALGIRSAGTIARAGDRMPEDAVAVSREHGGDPEAHAATPLSARTLGRPGLVLALAREHRRAVVETAPAASRSTFTLLEFGRLAEALDEDRARDRLTGLEAADRPAALIAMLAASRGLVGPTTPGDDDVPDPYRRSRAVYDDAAALMVPAVEQVARMMRLALSVPAPGAPARAEEAGRA